MDNDWLVDMLLSDQILIGQTIAGVTPGPTLGYVSRASKPWKLSKKIVLFVCVGR